jgi:hypothetical protein
MLLIFFASCWNYTTKYHDDKTGNLVVKEWFSRNHIKSVKIFMDKSLKNYIYTSYNNDGSMKDSARYINDTVEGLRIYYEEGPGLMHSEYYVHGIMNGIHKAEYKSGITSFEGYRKNNLMVGEWKFHFINGNPITYEYYDSSGVMKYFKKYDDNGNIVMTEGTGLILVRADQTSIKTYELLKGIVEVAIPPGSETDLTIEEITGSQYQNPKINASLKNPRFEWEWKFADPGKKILRFSLKITDNKTSEWEVSTFEQIIYVKDDN